jgi:gamma-glutamylcyclotransferase (GGCT)/AIG2-like uncharacterized protein YtfP
MHIEIQALVAFVSRVNELRRARGESAGEEDRYLLENVADTLFGSSQRLAVYGSLQPGGENHSIIEHLKGTWHGGFVRGKLLNSGWGAPMGYPAMRWDPTADRIPVNLFDSSDLESHWTRLDEFEGEEYVRILVPVENDDGVLAVANIYELRD